ncbi:MAG: helix-turn-helix domain-containing protein [Candidatus Cloacimonetes bacterium]|nr:helix-turn-helix domain-containing protein [Candidatus Cloacimonadota bacterium]
MDKKSLRNLKLLSINDLKEIFNISKTTVYRIVESRKIPFYKISGVIRFSEEDIINYLNENKIDKIK